MQPSPLPREISILEGDLCPSAFMPYTPGLPAATKPPSLQICRLRTLPGAAWRQDPQHSSQPGGRGLSLACRRDTRARDGNRSSAELGLTTALTWPAMLLPRLALAWVPGPRPSCTLDTAPQPPGPCPSWTRLPFLCRPLSWGRFNPSCPYCSSLDLSV